MAWAAFTVVTSSIAYYELLDHEAISNGDFVGLIAHACFFGSFAVSLLGVVGASTQPMVVCLGASVIAGIFEAVEVVQTAPGSITEWLSSLVGIWSVWLCVKLLGRPKTDLGMISASSLWFTGLLLVVVNL